MRFCLAMWCKIRTFAPPKGERVFRSIGEPNGWNKVNKVERAEQGGTIWNKVEHLWNTSQNDSAAKVAIIFDTKGTYMKRISIINRTTQKEGDVRLRFRLRDGRNVDLYHKSEIKATISELSKFDLGEAKVKAKVNNYNRGLERDIQTEVGFLNQAYQTMIDECLEITSEVFEKTIKNLKHPNSAEAMEARKFFEVRFEKYIEEGLRDGVFGEDRAKKYRTLLRIMKRFMIINRMDCVKVVDVDVDFVLRLRQFIADEYMYVEDWRQLYTNLSTKNVPTEKRSQNTMATMMKILQTFFGELEDRDEIAKSPFRMLGKERKRNILRECYDEPIYLKQSELMVLLNADVPEYLEETRKAFALQCALGCRISDFTTLTMNNVSVSESGIPFVHYLPIKTSHHLTTNTEIQTPLVKYAFDIVKESGFQFNILRNITGNDGYNSQIRVLLRVLKMDRKCNEFNETTQQNEYKPLWSFGSSKLARKTFVDVMSKVQVDLYASGLHKQGSKAVNRYTSMELNDRFVLMCTAFNQPAFKVNKKMEIVNE